MTYDSIQLYRNFSAGIICVRQVLAVSFRSGIDDCNTHLPRVALGGLASYLQLELVTQRDSDPSEP